MTRSVRVRRRCRTGTCAVSDLDFGRYYWKETQAPPGYDLPADVFSDPVTINAGNAGTTLPVRTFTDPRSLSRLVVEKLDATNQAPLDGAEFTLWTDVAPDGDSVRRTPWSAAAPPARTASCAVEDLDFGTYYWEETAAPTGYQLPVDVFSAPITVDTTNAGTTLPVRSFDDPRILSELTVHKVDATDDEPLAGAQFQLFHDTNPVGPDAGDVLVDTCTTTLPDGTCTVMGLDFGRYYWEETVPPTGYDLPANPFSSTITIDADNAGTALPVRTFRDPRATSRLVVEKLDATNQALLGGAEFTLWLDEDGNAGPPTDGDTSMGSCTTVPLLGRCSIADLDFGTYYWEETAAPTGYDLPADLFSDRSPSTPPTPEPSRRRRWIDPRTPGTLVVLKTDAGTDEPLADAEFTLWMDQDGNDGPPTTADEQMGTCTTALPSGSCEIDGLDFGVYYWEETTPPPGYELAADPFSAPIRVGPGGVRDVAYSAFRRRPCGDSACGREGRCSGRRTTGWGRVHVVPRRSTGRSRCRRQRRRPLHHGDAGRDLQRRRPRLR